MDPMISVRVKICSNYLGLILREVRINKILNKKKKIIYVCLIKLVV